MISIQEKNRLPPLSLYIHIPWCEKKCPYCDFNSHENKEDFSEEKYINCLLEDLKRDANLAQGRPLQSIFIGGGTPSLFLPENINTLLSGISQELNYADDIEITLEANPASSQADYFSALASTPVNRVSLGVQSFQNEKLTQLGRLHSADQAQSALSALNKSFANFNIDLMFGLPNQSIEDSLFDLSTALSFSSNHLSWYQLTIEPNTVFYRERPLLPDNDFIFDMQKEGQALLAKHAVDQYEISAYAKPQQYSRHNMNYWQFGDYLAIGAGAHGKISRFSESALEITRFQKKRMPKHYLAGINNSFMAKQYIVDKDELALEYFMNSLRLNQTSDWHLFQQRTGLSKNSISRVIDKAEKLKLITSNNTFIKKTELGQQHLDSLLGLF